jgi:hypothetical protein
MPQLQSIQLLQVQLQLPTITMATTTHGMSAASHQNALRFNPSKPCKLPRYFDEVKQLMHDHSIMDVVQKKFRLV